MSASPIQASVSDLHFGEFSQNYQTFKANHQKFTAAIQASGQTQQAKINSVVEDLMESYQAFKSNGRELLAVLEKDSDPHSTITEILARCKLIYKDVKKQASGCEPIQDKNEDRREKEIIKTSNLRFAFSGLIEDCKELKEQLESKHQEKLKNAESKLDEKLRQCKRESQKLKYSKKYQTKQAAALLKYNKSINELDAAHQSLTDTRRALNEELKSFKAGNMDVSTFKQKRKSILKSAGKYATRLF